MDMLAPNILDGFVGLGARFDSHPQLEPRPQYLGSCIDNCRTARLKGPHPRSNMLVEHVGTERLVQHIGSWICSLPTCSTDLLGWALGSIVIPNSNRAPNILDRALITVERLARYGLNSQFILFMEN
ncbi:hypothetical protein QE152_g31278 [Popillia japonica]|uniref:RNase H type-1 domain-containing protein n=1 Tax=Popillia japonica TaxID=7064 RepID=A0AAW1JBY0_POPJA